MIIIIILFHTFILLFPSETYFNSFYKLKHNFRDLKTTTRIFNWSYPFLHPVEFNYYLLLFVYIIRHRHLVLVHIFKYYTVSIIERPSRVEKRYRKWNEHDILFYSCALKMYIKKKLTTFNVFGLHWLSTSYKSLYSYIFLSKNY